MWRWNGQLVSFTMTAMCHRPLAESPPGVLSRTDPLHEACRRATPDARGRTKIAAPPWRVDRLAPGPLGGDPRVAPLEPHRLSSGRHRDGAPHRRRRGEICG